MKFNNDELFIIIIMHFIIPIIMRIDVVCFLHTFITIDSFPTVSEPSGHTYRNITFIFIFICFRKTHFFDT